MRASAILDGWSDEGTIHDGIGVVVGAEQDVEPPPELRIGCAFAVEERGPVAGVGDFEGRDKQLFHTLRIYRHGGILPSRALLVRRKGDRSSLML